MTKPPIIGMTTYSRGPAGEFCLFGTYIDAVQRAGGIPILLPPNQVDPIRIFDAIDGLILSGGGDINPELYGDSSHPMVYSVNAERDEFELALAKSAFSANIPILGICRGMQMLNIASGGDLIIHVPDAYGTNVFHRIDEPTSPVEHYIKLEPNSYLEKIMETTEIPVISWHHQAVGKVAPGWRIAATAPDGLVEAIEHESHPWMLAVQWHPEMSPKCSVNSRIFQAFVKAAASMALMKI
ncbi:MAG TPA: gamma-glutamyl-gamma-aminobutyrate hydrolase family protein [Kamptonema sp.]|nr:gamma-glutamyl-gamma-aminobutyrate hydrolase family protein [Kamptonema sp.]